MAYALQLLRMWAKVVRIIYLRKQQCCRLPSSVASPMFQGDITDNFIKTTKAERTRNIFDDAIWKQSVD